MRVAKVRAKSSPEMWQNPLSLASSRSYLPPIYPRRIPTLKAMEAEAEERKKRRTEQSDSSLHACINYLQTTLYLLGRKSHRPVRIKSFSLNGG